MNSIIPLDLGTSKFERSFITLRKHMGEKTTIKMIAYLIDGEIKILVDSGPPTIEIAKRYHPYMEDFKKTEEQMIESQLLKVGVKPEDIDVVVLTHLHWDHCYGLEKFVNAEKIVNKKEYCFALNPIPPLYVAYESLVLNMKPAFLQIPFTTIEGEKKIARGVTIFPTPGHTPGSQAVAVETEEGTYVIAGDAVMSYENLEGEPEHKAPYICPGIYVDMLSLWESMKRIGEMVGGDHSHVLPGHDPKVFLKERYP